MSMGKIFKALFVLALAGVTLATMVFGAIYWHFSRNLPSIITVQDYRPPIVSQVIVSDGKKAEVIGEFFKTERRYLVPYEQIPDRLVKAFISAEDDQFFQHQGINLASIIRAAIANFRAGHVVQGGSTITQQVAKSLLLTPERSFVRKAKELILASQIERNLTKQQILYLYLNQIYLGHGAYGVEAAAKIYFGKTANDLTIAESAIIAGMPQAPGKYSPQQNPKKAKERQSYVLRRMYENKFISKAELDQAMSEKLHVHGDVDVKLQTAPYLVEHIRRYLLEKYGEKQLYEEGLTITINGSADVMRKAGEVVKAGLRAVDKRNGYRGPIAKLKTAEEIEERLREDREKLVMSELGYDVLVPEGALNPLEAVKTGGLQVESDLLKIDKVYTAVVTSFDEKKKSTGAMIGAVKVEIPLEGLKWARPGVSTPTQVLQKGDVIYVKIEKKDGERVEASLEQDPEMQAALFSMDVHTGQVLAMEGGYDYSRSEFNRATQAQRQPGSAYKPIIFTAALERGFTPATVIVDAPIVYDDKEFGKWKPANFEEKFYGDTTLRMALVKSRNIPTIKIVQALGVPSLIEFSQRIGMKSQFNKDFSTALGSSLISLAELTKVYAVFPRLGRTIEPIIFNAVKDRDGKVLEEHKPKPVPSLDQVMKMAQNAVPAPDPSSTPNVGTDGNALEPVNLPLYPLANDPEQVIDPRIAFVATHLMKEVVTSGTGHEAKQLGRPAAGKTGTTNDYQDAWFMGFTPNVLTGVWVGYDNMKPIGKGETGARAALPIWLDFMKEAVKDSPPDDFTIPPGVVFASINVNTGKLAPPNSSAAIKEAFIAGTEPKETEAKTSRTKAPSTSDFLKEDIE